MNPNRRQFLRNAGAAVVAGSMPHARAQGSPLPDVTQLLLSQGFDASAPGSCLMAIISDTHMFLDPNDARFTNKLEDVLVDELNGLTPALSDLVIAGDQIISHSAAIGIPRYPSLIPRIREEFRTAKAQLQRFRSNLPIWMVPGNHDTDREDIEPTFWMEEMGSPAYQRINKGGVPVILLNSGHSSGLDPVQRAWLEAQAASIPQDQEVLVIAHHPSFFYIAGETALKRMVAEAFAGHRATVWMVGGHGHSFADTLFVDKGTRFVQMEVTCGNPKMFNDGKPPGYILLGLKDGKIAARIFRSLKIMTFEVRPPVSAMSPVRVQWPFEKIRCPGELFEESFYDRAGRFVSYAGVDLRFQFVFVQYVMFRIEPARFAGKLTEFLLLGWVGPASLPSGLCSFSSNGPNGPWISLPIPAEVSRVYRFSIPEQFRNVAEIHVKVSTAIPSPLNNSDLTVVGWGTAASPQSLTGYERWIAKRHRTFIATPATAPDAIAAGDTVSNIVRFAFNLPDGPVGSAVPVGSIGGLPLFSLTTSGGSVSRLVFPRMKEAANPGVNYSVQQSPGLDGWAAVPESEMSETILRSMGDWEEVQITIPMGDSPQRYFRVNVGLAAPLVE